MSGSVEGGERFSFRLPLPPTVEDCTPGVWAAERRIRKAYFAALDALRTGSVPSDRKDKLDRLRQQIRSPSAQLTLERLERVLTAVVRQDDPSPVLPAPRRVHELTATVPVDAFGPADMMARRFAWPVEWLRTRGYLESTGGHLRWRANGAIRLTPPSSSVVD